MITAEQARLLHANLPLSIGVGMVVAAILAFALRGHVQPAQLTIWLGAVLAVGAVRAAVWWAFRRANAGAERQQGWLWLLAAGACASGCVWGITALLIFPADSLSHQLFLGFVLACMASGGLSTLAVHINSYLMFLVPTLLPFALRQFYEGAELQMFMGTVFTLGIGFLMASAKRFEAVTVDSLALRIDNERLVEALRNALNDAEQANLAKSRFLADMSYEIRTPLAGIVGMAELLQKARLPQAQRRMAGAVSQSADTLLTLMDDLLDITRIESGTFELEAKPFDLRTCIEGAVDVCASAGYRKGLEIHLIAEQPLPLQVIGDAKRLQQVLISLIGATAQSVNAGQIAVRISCQCLEERRFSVTCSVLDNGSGLAHQELELLLTPPQAAGSSTRRRSDGRSVGMGATGKLIELMGGSVTLDSRIGLGSTVRFTLTMQSPVDTSDNVEREPSILSGKRVLVLDDRPLSREAIASRIRCSSATIELACSEVEALSKLRRAAHAGQPYHLVLIDRVRPRSDNLAIHRKIVTWPDLAGTKVIAMMPMHWSLDEATENELGAGAFILKPVKRAVLLVAIEKALRPRRLHVAEPPAGEQAQSATNAAVAPAAREALEGLKVLVAEDNPINQEMVLTFLEGFGCETSLARNGLEAIEAYEHQPFDVVLMDCQMPEVDGLSAIRHIRSRERSTGLRRMPIVMVTANAFAKDRERALEAGADAYLTKPYSEQQLRLVVQHATSRRAA